MPSGFQLLVDDVGVLVLTFDQPVTAAMFDSLITEIPKKLDMGIKKMLIDRRKQRIAAALSAGLEFGEAFGKMLIQRGVRVALLSAGGQSADDIIAAKVYNSGVPLAQFDSESEARLWLQGKIS